ncbi:DUF7003 family protein [Pedobacter frigoris]|uniref:DUF7003 family protein n=1 Tax=Pedobacter frigoris TaxID=2571272 RepID=UPI00292FB95F|nr:hypothetical protein [Pedobacter frigoris]
MTFTEKDILDKLDNTFLRKPDYDFPVSDIPGATKYNFFFDLENPVCEIAGSKIHLFADAKRWAIVFETNGYNPSGSRVESDLVYVGNCINYKVEKYPEHTYISNVATFELVTPEEYQRIRNKIGSEIEQVDLINEDVNEVTVHGYVIPFEKDRSKYTSLKIQLRDWDNPRNLIGYSEFTRFINETNPSLISATPSEIATLLPKDLPQILTLDKFHFSGIEKNLLPSVQELYQLIAKVLVTKDKGMYKPTLSPNNHWSNWESGEY